MSRYLFSFYTVKSLWSLKWYFRVPPPKLSFFCDGQINISIYLIYSQNSCKYLEKYYNINFREQSPSCEADGRLVSHKIFCFYSTEKFITLLTKSGQWFLPWTRSIQSIHCLFKVIFIIIFPSMPRPSKSALPSSSLTTILSRFSVLLIKSCYQATYEVFTAFTELPLTVNRHLHMNH